MENTMIVLTTTGTPEDAKSLARSLVEERLAACVNIIPIDSVYPWDGSVQEDSERLLVIKTTRERLAGLETRLHELHPYDVPEFVAVRTEYVADAYKAWLTKWIDRGDG